MTLLMLFYEFFRTGLFAVGGGLATLPFLAEMAVNHPEWLNAEMLANMVAVSESTPGPIGINVATYVGYNVAGIPGALVATLSLVLPSLIVIIIIARILDRFRENRYVKGAFSALRPAVAGLIAAACFSLMKISLFRSGSFASASEFFGDISPVHIAVFAVILAALMVKKISKLHPAVIILAGAVCGVVLKL